MGILLLRKYNIQLGINSVQFLLHLPYVGLARHLILLGIVYQH